MRERWKELSKHKQIEKEWERGRDELLTSQDGRCELILAVEKYGSCLNALKALVDRRRDVRVRCEQEGCHCFQEGRRASSVNRALLMIVFLLHSIEPTGDGSLRNARNTWPLVCAPTVIALQKPRLHSAGGSQSVVAQPRRSDHVIASPSPHASKTGEGGGGINPLRAPVESRLFPHSRPSRTTSLRR